MLTLQTLIDVVTGQTAVSAALYATIKTVIEKKNAKTVLQTAEPLLAPIVQVGEKVVEDVIHSPKVAELELKISKFEGALHETKLGHLAATALHSFGKTASELTPDEQSTAILYVQTEAKKLGIDVTPSQVVDALTAAEKAVSTFRNSELFKTTQSIVQVKNEVSAKATSAPLDVQNTSAPGVSE